MDHVGVLLRRARIGAGLTQAELARRSGTSQPTLSAYERGRKTPNAGTLVRLLAVAGATLDTADLPATIRDWLRRRHNPSQKPPSDAFAGTAARVSAGEPWNFVLRELLDGVYRWHHVSGPAAVATLARDEPDLTGDQRFDALLAGLAEHLAAAHGYARPHWTCDPKRFLDHWWFPHSRRGFDALALRDAPAAFRRRGVMLHPSMLERR